MEDNNKKQPTFRLGFNEEEQEFPEYGFRLTLPDGREFRMKFDNEGRLVISGEKRLIVFPCVSNQIALKMANEQY